MRNHLCIVYVVVISVVKAVHADQTDASVPAVGVPLASTNNSVASNISASTHASPSSITVPNDAQTPAASSNSTFADASKAVNPANPSTAALLNNSTDAAATDASPTIGNWSTYTTQAGNLTAGFTSTSPGAKTLQVGLVRDVMTQYGASFKDLTVDITPETETRLHVKIWPTGQKRWEVPESIVLRPGPAAGLRQARTLYGVEQPSGRPDEPFALSIVRRSTGARIFDTRGHPFLFKDQYIEFTTTLPKNSDLYGIGEVSLNTGLLLPRNGSTITLWNRDAASAYQNVNLYGSHPFYLQINGDGSSHGVFLLNSNGMDITLTETQLTYRIIGGLVDLYFFLGPTPEAVIRQYHQVIGAPAMPPYWALGFHQSKWGYANISVLEEVVANYSAVGLPLESVWVDIEYMQSRFRTMTFDQVRYPVAEMRKFVQKLHSSGQYWVPIIDPAVSVDAQYGSYLTGTRDNVWMKDHKGDTYVGQVWPGESVYPDYLSAPNISSWLIKELKQFHDQVPFDGLWLDMCEPSNFCTGMNCKQDRTNAAATYWLNVDTPVDYNSIARPDIMLVKNRTTCQMICEQPAVTNSLANPPYEIKNGGWLGWLPLSHKTIHPTAKHADGASEYNAHNLYGTSMAQRHYEAAVAVTKKRPFLLTRSTSPGAGRFTGHWTGDNAADWKNLHLSIAGMINTNFWGMSMAGADICGYIDMMQENRADPANMKLSDTEFQELCGRWASVGAFYPFSRNHMIIYSRSHEFYRWPDVTAAAKKAYGLRYQLLTYFYTALFMANTQGGTLARPLFFTDPSDLRARNATEQWMMGEAVLISPVLASNTTTVRPYFTAGTWYSAWDYNMLRVKDGRRVQFNVPYGHVPVHYRGGAIVPIQRTPTAPKVTRDVRYTPVTLVVTLPAETSWGVAGVATAVQDASGPLPPYILEEPCASVHRRNAGRFVSCGMLYMDQDDLKTSTNNTLQVWYTAITGQLARSGTIENLVIGKGSTLKNKIKIRAIHILGVPGNARDVASASVYGKQSYNATYDPKMKVVRISGIDFDAGRSLTIDWWLRSAPQSRSRAYGQ